MINGFKISNTKLDQNKFFGVIFYKKLSFIPHIQYLKEKCSKTLKFLRVIAHKDWGADQHTLLKLYKILIRSKIDHGAFIYGAARKSHLKLLRTVHHEELRLILGGFRTSPEESLNSEAYGPSLKIRFTKLGLQYYCKQKFLPSNPAHDCTFNPKQQNLFELREKTIKNIRSSHETHTERHRHFTHKHSWSYLPTPPLGQDMTRGQFFKRSLTGLNSEFFLFLD